MPNVGIDISALSPEFKEHALRGIGRYAFELQKFFAEASSEKIKVDTFRHSEVSVPKWIDSLITMLPAGQQTVRQQIFFPITLGLRLKKRFDLLHFLAQTDAPSWCTQPYALTVHDVIPLALPDLYKANKPNWRYNLARYLEQKAIRNAHHIFTVSNHSARDIERYLGIPPEKISVTYNGISEIFFSEPTKSSEDVRMNLKLPSERKIILYVGGIDPRKNIVRLIEIFEVTCRKMLDKGESLPILVLAGRIRNDREYPRLFEVIKASAFRNEIFETDFIADEDLVSLFKTASVFAFPSLYEGFGLTPLEAAASGLPVVSSNRSCMPEVLEDAALLCDPDDIDRFATHLVEVLCMSDLAESLQVRGPLQARKFNWYETGQKTLAVYEKILCSK
jgi:glycosyltransferase involved in cell wall biosynthesis